MARRVGRRKAPPREKHMLKEQIKVDSGIFDERTMIYLSKFFNKGIIETLLRPIARGKEADLYIATPGSAKSVEGIERVAIKFFRVETSSFFKMQDYIIGDRRFTKKIARRSKIGIITEWCKKEFINLQLAARAGINAPRPLMFHGTILAMSFIGNGETPAPQLRHCELDEPGKTMGKILRDAGALYRKGLVHADLSEYNILMHMGEPYMIDFGQAVDSGHPNAMLFLRRDVTNILSYFLKRYGIEKDAEEEVARIIK